MLLEALTFIEFILVTIFCVITLTLYFMRQKESVYFMRLPTLVFTLGAIILTVLSRSFLPYSYACIVVSSIVLSLTPYYFSFVLHLLPDEQEIENQIVSKLDLHSLGAVSKEAVFEMFRDELKQQAEEQKRCQVERNWEIYFIVATVMCVVIDVAIEYWPDDLYFSVDWRR